MEATSWSESNICRYPDHRAWAEMLAGMAHKNARLAALVAKRWPPRSADRLLAELERERTRIARELHAGAGQPLAGIKMHLEILNEGVAELPASAQTTIGRLQVLADQALGQVRAVSHRLHPPDWQELSAGQALASLAETSGLPESLRWTQKIEPLREEPAHATRVQLYRCAQECISNIIRHSGATEASLSLVADKDRVVLTVTDNGRGFDVTSRKSGMGLRAMQENAASIGGTCRVSSSPGSTRIVVSLPLNED